MQNIILPYEALWWPLILKTWRRKYFAMFRRRQNMNSILCTGLCDMILILFFAFNKGLEISFYMLAQRNRVKSYRWRSWRKGKTFKFPSGAEPTWNPPWQLSCLYKKMCMKFSDKVQEEKNQHRTSSLRLFSTGHN